MTQPSLFTTVPRHDGPDLDAGDQARLGRQMATVSDLMRDGRWRTLAEIASLTGAPEASVSARLRDLRKPKFGGYVVERRRVSVGRGTWLYRVI